MTTRSPRWPIVVTALIAAAICSFLPIWGVIVIGQYCGVGRLESFWTMIDAAMTPDPPPGQFPRYNTYIAGGITFTGLAVALAAVGQYLFLRFNRAAYDVS